MPWLLLIVVVIVVILGSGATRGHAEERVLPQTDLEKPLEPGAGSPEEPRGDLPTKLLTRDEILSRLREFDGKALAKAKEPPPPMAMCYSPMMPDNSPADYICPTCHTKAQYPRDSFTDPQPFRRMMDNLRALPLALDESDFCPKCADQSPRNDGQLTQERELRLGVTWPDGAKHTTRVFLSDLQLLEAFLRGQTGLASERDDQHLLDKAKRLHQLLGLPPEQPLPDPPPWR